ncbi:spermidine synthase [Paenibacillus hodogayensis]|uniref:Spermidine synthase n=1 Tax=Paenibacillus hodogayensis TaxID=279208 RepID=A0ABV5VZT8_9BACL
MYDTEELYGEKGKFRTLQFSDEAVQGAIDLNNPGRILFEYVRGIVHLMEFNSPFFEDAFVIGHGIGTVARHFAERRVKAAELDAKVVSISRDYFGYAGDRVVVGDGRRILEEEADRAYDYIVLDAFTEKGTPSHFTSREFFSLALSKLDPRGAVIMNLFGKSGHHERIQAIHATLGEQFAYTKSFTIPSRGRTDVLNVIMVGRNRPIGYQARHMAGFAEFDPGPGRIIVDGDDWPRS